MPPTLIMNISSHIIRWEILRIHNIASDSRSNLNLISKIPKKQIQTDNKQNMEISFQSCFFSPLSVGWK